MVLPWLFQCPDCKNDLHNDDLTLSEKAKSISDQLTPVLDLMREGRDRDARDILEELSYAQDEEEFDDALENLYDWADEERVWLGLG